MDFIEEINSYSDDDLDLIISTQKELYTKEEMAQLIALQQKRNQEKTEKRREEILSQLPDTITCEKCDGPNPFHNSVCNYCGHKLDKKRYYSGEYLNDDHDKVNPTISEETGNSYAFHHIISFLIPLIGFIVGAVMLANDDSEKQSCGKACIVLGIVSVVINVIIVSNLLK